MKGRLMSYTTHTVSTGNCRFEVLTDGERFVGLGAIYLGDRLVRSGRLPMAPYFATYAGLELQQLHFRGVETNGEQLIIRCDALLERKPIAEMRDHSLDPIHDLGDWEVNEGPAGYGSLRLVLAPAAETLEGHEFTGFSYQYEYEAGTPDSALYWIMDRASWELDGDITGATAVSQSACSIPEATFAADTAWTTEGILPFLVEEGGDVNPVMTHNLPRWASHGSFDYQFKGDATLIGLFSRVGLIRSVLVRDPGKPELKTFDKHIFDQEMTVGTVPKRILLNTDPKSGLDQRNLWTWLMDIVHDRARAEFGLREEPIHSLLAHTYWVNYTADSMFRDFLPAATALAVDAIFAGDNMKKSDYSAKTLGGNLCGGHEFEIAEEVGGTARVKEVIDRFDEAGIFFYNWTNNDQSVASGLLIHQGEQQRDWLVKMDDARTRYGGAYIGHLVALNFKNDGAYRYWTDSHAAIKAETGMRGYLFDSFYNLAFMPVDYADRRPTTMWKELLASMKELQDNDVHFLIESFGPFGAPEHGCHAAFAEPGMEYTGYKTHPACNYYTVPAGTEPLAIDLSGQYYRLLAHMMVPPLGLYFEGIRLDHTPWADDLRHAHLDYRTSRPYLHKRYLQPDGQSVLWHDAAGTRATLWNFTERELALPGAVTDLTTGEPLPPADRYPLRARHTYTITGSPLPTVV